jgi:DNA helicase-2/ATP-dependent DNA helicase PcrA
MKKEAWSPEIIEKAAKDYLDDLPNREKFVYKKANSSKGIKAGDLNMRLFEPEQEHMTKLVAATKGYEFINTEMLKSRRYDYNDMILWVLEAFRTNPALLAKYQEKYHYFLVDEYQDTNGAQNEILNLLTSYWEVPNVFVVGDDDQAIYRFQGANISNIIEFYDRHKANIKVFLMTENYRSTQAILSSSAHLINHNQERLVNKIDGLSKDLKSSHPTLQDSTLIPEIREYYNPLHQEAAIAMELEQLYLQGKDLSEIAVIYRNHRLVENLVKILAKKGVPLNIKHKINILELPFVQNIIKILQYIWEEYNTPHSAESMLFEIMHYSFFGISPKDIAVINRECRYRDNAKIFRWRELIGSREMLFRLNIESAREISGFDENLTAWINDVPNVTVQVLFEKIITRGGVLTWVLKSPEKEWYLQIITSLFDFIKEESARVSYLRLPALLETLQLMTENNIPLFLSKILHHESGINFITAHSSKGLEFEKVYLVSANADCWDKPPRNSSFKIPDTLLESSDTERCEDERRLFYVAMTRAKESLVISYAGKKLNEKEDEPSRFVAEVIQSGQVKYERVSVPDHIVLEIQGYLLEEASSPEISFMDVEFLKSELKDYKMSVTHLNKYLRCPLSFYFENILKVPSARNENIGFGNAVHYALYHLFQQMVQDQSKRFPSVNLFLAFFKKGLEIYHSHFTEKDFKRRLEFGNTFLPSYFNHYLESWNKVVKTEYRINNCVCEGVPITGALDKIEFDGKAVNVVDYKTGNPENAKEKLMPPTDKNPDGGDYWRQIVFYRLLLDNDKSTNYTMLSGEIDFVQPDSKNEFRKSKIFVGPQDIEIVKEQVKDTHRKIMNLEFTKGCGKEDCSWCTFVKYNYNSKYIQTSDSIAEEE